MFYRLKTAFRKRYFNLRCKGILDTPLVRPKDSGPVILTQLVSVDLFMYLVAVKSLLHRIGTGRIVLLLDKDWSRRGLDILERQVAPWKILYVKDQSSNSCPVGGTWERLLTIAKLVEDNFVIQLDADTLTLRPVEEVTGCVANETSFMIGTWKGQEIESAAAAANRVRSNTSQHVQILAEQRLEEIDDERNLGYARGQSSFAGFAKGSFSVASLEDFCARMQALLGTGKWAEWGSESFASNFFVANARQARVLPWPKYASYNPRRDADFSKSAFLHFEGTYRFKNGAYIGWGRNVIRDLSTHGP